MGACDSIKHQQLLINVRQRVTFGAQKPSCHDVSPLSITLSSQTANSRQMITSPAVASKPSLQQQLLHSCPQDAQARLIGRLRHVQHELSKVSVDLAVVLASQCHLSGKKNESRSKWGNNSFQEAVAARQDRASRPPSASLCATEIWMLDSCPARASRAWHKTWST